jgi:hypothetical protein
MIASGLMVFWMERVFCNSLADQVQGTANQFGWLVALIAVAGCGTRFPDDRYRDGAGKFPTLVPTLPDNDATPENKATWEVLEKWEKPLITEFSNDDMVSAGERESFKPGGQAQKVRSTQQLMVAVTSSRSDAAMRLQRSLTRLLKTVRCKSDEF